MEQQSWSSHNVFTLQLPCIGMGTPVIFINSPSMPGGGGSNDTASSRVTGLTELFHTVNLYTVTDEVKEAREWLTNFPWENPPPNPNINLMMRLRATFWNVISSKSNTV